MRSNLISYLKVTKVAEQELHSSRMLTACMLAISPSIYCAGGVCLGRGVCLDRWGVCLGGGGGGVCLDRGSALAGGGRGGILACTEADPTVNRITDACRGCLVTYPIMHFMLNVCCLHIN